MKKLLIAMTIAAAMLAMSIPAFAQEEQGTAGMVALKMNADEMHKKHTRHHARRTHRRRTTVRTEVSEPPMKVVAEDACPEDMKGMSAAMGHPGKRRMHMVSHKRTMHHARKHKTTKKHHR